MKGKKLLVGILIATLISCGGVFFVLNKYFCIPEKEYRQKLILAEPA